MEPTSPPTTGSHKIDEDNTDIALRDVFALQVLLLKDSLIDLPAGETLDAWLMKSEVRTESRELARKFLVQLDAAGIKLRVANKKNLLAAFTTGTVIPERQAYDPTTEG